MEYKQSELLEEVMPISEFNPSTEELAVVQRVYHRFLDMETERDKARKEFDGRTLSQYVLDSMNAYNGVVSDEIKKTKDDWQSLAWDHKTRGKVKAVISLIVGARPFVTVIGKNRESHKFAGRMLDVYEDTWKQEKGSYKLFLQAMSACTKGTVIVEEMYNEQKVMRKDIISVDQETGQVDFVEKEAIKGGAGKVEARIVPLLDFYPNENSAEIEHDCCVVKEYTMKDFLNKYGKYPNAKFVAERRYEYKKDYNEYKEETLDPNKLIQVLSYYNEDWDEHVILANNFWLNKQKGDKVSPLPFDHKRLPFTKTVFELADEECFYGKSLPDLMRGEQDTANALERLMVDREILSLNRGFMLGAGVEIDDYELYPGAVHKVTGGNPNIPINQQIMEQPMAGANQSAFQLLQLLGRNSDTNTSIDPTAQGVSSGGRKTARETVILDENAKRNSGPFQIHIYKLLWDRAELRIPNIVQFYTSPLQTVALKDEKGDEMLDENGEAIPGEDKFREISVTKPGKNPEWFFVDPKMKGTTYNIRFVEDYEMPQSQSARMELASARLAESKQNPLLNADECTIDYLEAMRSDPERFYLKPTPQAVDFQNNQGIPPQNPPIQQ